MSAEAVIAEARAQYKRCAPVAPAWDDLGGVTQSVWIERVESGYFEVEHQIDLFT